MPLLRLEWHIGILLTYVLLLHASTLYIFTRGFLLTRLSLTNITECTDCTIPATHSRLVLLIIDALRFDFIAENPSINPSPYYHNVLTLPAELTAKYPTQSFIFDTYSDPPTATLQRIKGITTGSLPTFVDAGSNFGGSQILEDSLLRQLQEAKKKVAFMGDDTWMTVYPTTFEPNLTFPFDSFNVEDLHTVDEGVIKNLFPLLQNNRSTNWDVLIGHFLGVDHVGHRLGPAHSTMKAKLTQMNQVLSQVVEQLDDDTLLVVLGDHGMDRKGDHGGDGEHETHAATWIYSKSRPLFSPHVKLPSLILPKATFPEAPLPHRFIQQIDLVPTISLLLGIRIPFNNLGSLIPEVFGWAGEKHLEQALRLNTNQIKAYLDAYRSSPSGGELDGVWDHIEESWKQIKVAKGMLALETQYEFNRFVLSSCRSLWARFNIVLMYLGLFCMGLGTAAVFALYSAFNFSRISTLPLNNKLIVRLFVSLYAGCFMGIVFWFSFPSLAFFTGFVELLLVCTIFTSSVTIISSLTDPSFFSKPPVILILHAVAFLSNSFTFWEERIITFLLTSSAIPYLFTSFAHPLSELRLRRRLVFFSIAFIACIRLASISTICREEQQPYCHVTYYASSMLSSPPLLVLILSIPASLLFPYVLRRFLAISASDKGPAPYILESGFRIMLLMGNLSWILEHLESTATAGNAFWFRVARTEFARFAIGISLIAGHLIWWFLPLCLEVKQNPLQFIGFANSYGSLFMLFTINTFSIVFATTQLSGQLALLLCYLGLFILLEMTDSALDIRNQVWVLHPPSMDEIVPVGLLGLLAFFTTGHQATMPSIQWKSAFLLSPVLKYPISPLLVIINTFGPIFIFALSVPILSLWKKPPLGVGKVDNKTFSITSSTTIQLSILRVCFGLSLYFSVLLFSSAASAAWLRRHLMVWKVFAPRFMLAGASMLTVDLGLLIGALFGTCRVIQKVQTFYKPLETDKDTKSQ
ncbi:hypothetical protein Clacol_001958 [Clathrus columnatus]|uniref:GPI ethanolamine phosphate transferase 3 n=1 Tax=Clathrus columnatus TaxID=1419009 RepID=A0AAV5A512_9AGAM|nr:hypothetical protein Clacol_001958 [Clathrus columnatus]